MKLKLIILTIFMIVNGVFYYINTQSSTQRIDLTLNQEIKNIQVQYSLTKDYFLSEEKSIQNSTNNNKKVLAIFSKAQRDILRQELYNLLLPFYKRIHSKGILQFQFVFTDNISFLRMHKPSKFGDDLTDIRYSFKYANSKQKAIEGFEQGRTTHGFRYV